MCDCPSILYVHSTCVYELQLHSCSANSCPQENKVKAKEKMLEMEEELTSASEELKQRKLASDRTVRSAR